MREHMSRPSLRLLAAAILSSASVFMLSTITNFATIQAVRCSTVGENVLLPLPLL